MYDRRRHKRLPIQYELSIHELFRQEENKIVNIDEKIELTNISRTGIGFITDADLPQDYYFEAKVAFSEKDYFYCVLKIIRKKKGEEGNIYGTEFVGMPDYIKSKIDEYGFELRD